MSDWNDLGLHKSLIKVCKDLKWEKPTRIQSEAIPVALEGRDIVALAQTGSGKTAAFALPILHELFQSPRRYAALVLTPTRDLALQISSQFEALGVSIGVKCSVLIGGNNMMNQTMELAKKPHIIIATPGRIIDHFENTKGFTLKNLNFLVLDEADRVLSSDFEGEVNKILKILPRERRTYLFSATMTSKVNKLQRASLKNPVRIEVSNKYQTVHTLQSYCLFQPMKFKEMYLVYLLKKWATHTVIIFRNTCDGTMDLALFLRNFDFKAIPIHGKLLQNERNSALNKFRSKEFSILVATDVASRGLDIHHVDLVINYDVPIRVKDYIHRVGRTARAGQCGTAITFLTPDELELYKEIEDSLEKKLPLYSIDEDEVKQLQESVEKMKTKTQEQKKQLKKGGKAGSSIMEEYFNTKVTEKRKKFNRQKPPSKKIKRTKF